MLINTHKRYVKKYRVGGSGLFDTLTRLMASDTAKAAAKMLSSAATSDVGKSAIGAGKAAAKELATAAISAAKDAAIDKLKRQRLTHKNKEILDNLVNGGGAVRIQDLVSRGRGLKLA